MSRSAGFCSAQRHLWFSSFVGQDLRRCLDPLGTRLMNVTPTPGITGAGRRASGDLRRSVRDQSLLTGDDLTSIFFTKRVVTDACE